MVPVPVPETIPPQVFVVTDVRVVPVKNPSKSSLNPILTKSAAPTGFVMSKRIPIEPPASTEAAWNVFAKLGEELENTLRSADAIFPETATAPTKPETAVVSFV